MKISDLSNEEVVFLFTLIGDMKIAYDEIIEEQGITHSMATEIGKMKVFQPLEDEHIEELKASDRVLLINSVTEKLKPVADLIAESNPELADRIQECLIYKSKDEDKD